MVCCWWFGVGGVIGGLVLVVLLVCWWCVIGGNL